MLSAAELGHAANRLILIIGIAFVALPFLLVMLALPGAARHLWLAVALVLAVFVPLAFYQVRWSSYAQVALLVPYSAALGWLMQRLAGRLPRGALLLCRPLLIVTGLFWPLLLGQAFPQQQIVTADRGCPIARLAPALGQAAAGGRGTVLAMADYGPEILYRTSQRACCRSPTTARSRASPPPGASSPRPTRRPPGPSSRAPGSIWSCSARTSSSARSSAARSRPAPTSIAAWSPARRPAWLRPVALPPEVADAARLFAFVPGPAAAPAGPELDPAGAAQPPPASGAL